MRAPRAGEVALALGVALGVAVIVAGREASGLSAPLVLGGVVAGAVTVVVLAHWGLERVAVVLLAVGVATSSWNAVAVGPLKLAHGALAASGLLLLVVAVRERRSIVGVPAWVWALGAAITAVAAASTLWPASPSYVAGRYSGHETEGIANATVTTGTITSAGLVNGATWLVAAVAVPAVVCLAVAHRPDRVRALADAWVMGATVSAAVALTDRAGLTAVSEGLLDVTDYGGRQAALTVQPNHAAVAIAIALPLVLWRLATGRRPAARVAAIGALATLVGGLLVTGSRAGFAASLVGALVITLVEPRLRARLPLLSALAVPAVIGMLVGAPSVASALAAATRLDGSGGAEASDEIRLAVAGQGLDDAAHSPLFGIGLGVVDEAHSVVLQLLASGGVLLFVGFTVAWCGFVLDGWTLRRRQDGLPGALVVAGLTVLVVNLVTNTLTDVFVYIPFALVAGLCSARLPDPDADEPGAGGPPRSDPVPVALEARS